VPVLVLIVLMRLLYYCFSAYEHFLKKEEKWYVGYNLLFSVLVVVSWSPIVPGHARPSAERVFLVCYVLLARPVHQPS